EYVAAHMDSDLQFVLADSGVSLEGQVAIARRLRKEACKMIVRDGISFADALHRVIHDPELKVLYLFAGKRRQSDVSTFLKKLEEAGKIRLQLQEFDIERSETHDLRSKELWDQICETLKVYPEKVKHRKLDDSEFNPIANNYQSAQVSSTELEAKFREEEALGRMYPTRFSTLKQEFGEERIRIAAMAAIAKPDGTVRPLHDGTHSVQVNNRIVYRDQIQCPGPAEVAAVVRESVETLEAPFCVSADIKAAHRQMQSALILQLSLVDGKYQLVDGSSLFCRSPTCHIYFHMGRGHSGPQLRPSYWRHLQH
ncbi:unnamed protein product, partial [Cladocopium goreaui]